MPFHAASFRFRRFCRLPASPGGCRRRGLPVRLAALALAAALSLPAEGARAQLTAYRQAVAEAAFGDEALAAFYRDNGHAAIWTGDDAPSRARRAALIEALRGAALHGLPVARYDPDGLLARMGAARTARDRGLVEIALSRAFLRYANDLHAGVLVPSEVDRDIDRENPRLEAAALLSGLAAAADPGRYIRSLAPASREYRALLRERLRLERLIAAGGWGPTVPARRKLEPGQSGADVIALRDRLIRMGYLSRSVARVYDGRLTRAVQAFQVAHGLRPDGVAGRDTIAEINRPPEERLKAVLVAMERERWLGDVRRGLYIMVNQTDFRARMIDRGEVIYETRTVIGKNAEGRRSPEFSDEMELLVVNPSWYVPRSIIVKEYLPQLQRNPYAASQLVITDVRGRVVNRAEMDFTRFTARNFPFDMRQPPGPRNALGRVKFLFPNKHAVYMHDTPEKHLFSRDKRDFSHGCIRLADPFDFAHKLLSMQVDDPEGYFRSLLESGQETEVRLKKSIPVHLIYRTAFADDRGRIGYRHDVYGRDAKIWAALERAGVALPAVRG